MRLSSTAPLYIRGVGKARATGGYVDPSTVTDVHAWRRKERERKAEIVNAAKRERKERKTREKTSVTNEMLLVQAQLVYDVAPAGAEKRTALVKLRKAQERCGIFPDVKPDLSVDVSTGAAGWLDDNRG